MADQPQTTPTNDTPTLSVVAPSPSPQAPVSPAPAAAPVAATAAPASETVALPTVSPPQTEAGASAATEQKLPSDVPTLLEESSLEKPKTEEAKPAEADKKADETAKPEEPKAPEPPKLPPVEYKYELPETLKMDDATKGKLHEGLDAFRTDPTNPQKLVDLHNEVVSKVVEDIRKGQYDTFNTTRKGWQDQVRADEELGGAGFETTMRAVARMRDMFVPPNRREAFNEMLRVTGAGDHPEMVRMLRTAARFYDEPAMAPQNIKPPANIGKPPRGRGAADLYPNTTFSK